MSKTKYYLKNQNLILKFCLWKQFYFWVIVLKKVVYLKNKVSKSI